MSFMHLPGGCLIYVWLLFFWTNFWIFVNIIQCTISENKSCVFRILTFKNGFQPNIRSNVEISIIHNQISGLFKNMRRVKIWQYSDKKRDLYVYGHPYIHSYTPIFVLQYWRILKNWVMFPNKRLV